MKPEIVHRYFLILVTLMAASWLLAKEHKVVKMYEKVSVRVEHGKYVACTFFSLG